MCLLRTGRRLIQNRTGSRVIYFDHGFSAGKKDYVTWQKGATKAGLHSELGNTTHVQKSGSIQITGLPKGLTDSQFVLI